MSNNCVFGWPDFTQATPLHTPTAAGGAWTAGLPVSNVLDRRLSRVARSVDASSDSTVLLFDLGTTRQIGLISMLIPNITVSAVPTVRFLVFSDAAYTVNVYNSGFLQAIPTGLTVEDLTGADGSRMNLWQTHVLSAAQTQRYVAINIVDTANADGYVDVARVIIAGAFSPAINTNISDGAKHQLQDDTVRTVTEGGAALYNAKRGRRTDSFAIDDFVDSDAALVRQMQRRLGKSGQFFWVPDPADTVYGYQRNYLAVMEELGALTANSTRTNGEFSVLEEL